MKIDKRSDAKLVVAFQSGDKKALATLVKKWHLMFCEKAFWLVKDADLSKDIAQDTWKTIIAKIEDLKDTSSFGSWALRIVYSKSLDVLRTKNSERFKQEEYVKNQEVIVEDNNENTTLKRKLLLAIQDLPEQQQQVIKLFYVEEYSLKEISKTLNISIGTAKSRLFYARERLKTILKNRNYEK
ncbi:RNA polymerase sigma factor [Lacinutrix sp. WUR7]|uniref:RNA polymerase sigma factor n=1 Tax=Lacinutrix sp. WUR7 TaxID=2653681 RepID=UPI00193CBAE6|nr:RNA polymerase sigma factor [Lacinutrix sp. WUR7]